MESDPMFKFAKAIAYGSKGLFQIVCQKPDLDVYITNSSKLIRELELSDEHLDYLERALKEIREMEETDPNHLGTMCALGDETFVSKIDMIAVVLEKCRPGRVQQIMGELKLMYFGNRKIGSIKERPLTPSSIEDKVAYLLNFCEFINPDLGLEIIDSNQDLEFMSNPLTKLAKTLAFGSKAVLYQLHQRPEINVATMEQSELRQELGLDDERLDELELALQEFAQIERTYPKFVESIASTPMEDKLDTIAVVLERCRPGRVQELLGKTKLNYFGVDRISTVPRITDEEKLPPKELGPFLYIPFTFSSVAKSALVFQIGKDVKGRKYILCWLFGKVFDDFGDNETFGDAKVGEIYLFDDGTFSYTLERKSKNTRNSEESKTLLQLGKIITDDVTDKAIEVRDSSRLLRGMFAAYAMILIVKAKTGEASESDYFKSIDRSFQLGYVAVKGHEDVDLIDTFEKDKIGALNGKLDDKQLEWCMRFSDTIKDVNKNELDQFFSKYTIAKDILEALSKSLVETANIHEEVVGGKLCAAFVLGYAGAKYPKKFRKLEETRRQE